MTDQSPHPDRGPLAARVRALRARLERLQQDVDQLKIQGPQIEFVIALFRQRIKDLEAQERALAD